MSERMKEICSASASQLFLYGGDLTWVFLSFNWSIVDLQCCVNFCCTAKWFSYTYIYIFNILFHYGLSQCIEYSSMCYTVAPMFIAALLTIAKTWKQPKCPLTDKWIKKMWYVYTMEYYWAIKKNKIMPFAATWTDLEIIILSEVRQRKTNNTWSLICGI